LSDYHDQTDVFFTSPRAYLEHYFPPAVDPAFPPSLFPTSIPGEDAPTRVVPAGEDDDGVSGYPWKHSWPRRLVMFGALLDRTNVKAFLLEKGYVEEWRRGRVWEGEGERKGGVRVWRWSKSG